MLASQNGFISIRSKSPKRTLDVDIPAILYHASPLAELTELIPQSKTIRDPLEGPVVFATPDLAYATMFLVPTDDSWTLIGVHNNLYFMAISNRNRFEELDKGGAIYSLPVDNFYCDLAKAGREKEWVCKASVVPLNKTTVTSALFTMMEHGVQVYFVSEEIFSQMYEKPSTTHTLLRSQQSENEERGVNFIPFT